MRSEFPGFVSYNRFVELMQKVLLPLAVYLKTRCLGKCTGISYVGSTHLKACHIKRAHSNKVLKVLLLKGDAALVGSLDWSYILSSTTKKRYSIFCSLPGNVDDRKPLIGSNLMSMIYRKLFGDKGYISQSLFEKLLIGGIHLITKLRKNMKNSLMLLPDKILLRKRALIESVYDELKNICQIEHIRHRSLEGFIMNLLSGLIAYSCLSQKPFLNLEIIDQ
jgi:hypothetical protein